MKAFVLAAGFGSRLRPLTNDTPKPLVPVLNVPSICYTLALLKEAGIDTVICNVHYHTELIHRFFSEHNNFGMDIQISEETTILGTGGGLKRCEHMLDNEPFLLINSDIIANFNLKSFFDCHNSSQNQGTLMLFKTPEAKTIGDVGMREGKVWDFRNMRKTGLHSDYIYAGAAVLSPSIFPYLSMGFSSIVDTGFTGLIAHESLGYFRHEGFWQDIGTTQSFWGANITSRKNILNLGKRIRRQTELDPHTISSHAVIHSDATVHESVVGRQCCIDKGASVCHSVLLPGSVIEKNSVIDRAIVFPGGMISVD
ncbi:MAG: NDP-sugar synthase [Chlorobium phaeobacteroides]|uniref:Nucleotidyl transferase n=1 Tax=Chlorobium phaeobacteroides (strain BS1) TaxID=331678 RepID=B3EL05_CHLPB|nr:NDP-sugar synthase [Chlorobium phaeobacteroides]NEX13438.1 nucleotidyl transferase [Prosthecochloris sp.]